MVGSVRGLRDAALRLPDGHPDGGDLSFREAEELGATLAASAEVMREAMRERERSEQRLAGILHAARGAIIVTEASRRIQLFNAAAESIFRLRGERVIGEPLRMLFTTAGWEAYCEGEQGAAQAVEPGEVKVSSTTCVRHGDPAFPASFAVSSMLGVDGERIFIVIDPVDMRGHLRRHVAEVAPCAHGAEDRLRRADVACVLLQGQHGNARDRRTHGIVQFRGDAGQPRRAPCALELRMQVAHFAMGGDHHLLRGHALRFVPDDGKGCGDELLLGDHVGIGVRSMKARAHTIGGTLFVRDCIRGGCQVYARWPARGNGFGPQGHGAPGDGHHGAANDGAVDEAVGAEPAP